MVTRTEQIGKDSYGDYFKFQNEFELAYVQKLQMLALWKHLGASVLLAQILSKSDF